jgi:hypothetical protein
MPLITFIQTTRRGLDGFVEVSTGRWWPILCGAGGGDDPPPTPQPTPKTQDELDLQHEQLIEARRSNELAATQGKEQEAFAGRYYANQGIRKVVDPTTGAITFEDIPEAELPQDVQDTLKVGRLANARSIAGLEGRLPVGDAVTNDWDRGEQQLISRLTEQFGPGWENSTGGSRAMAEFRRARTSTEDAVREGRITGAEAIVNNRQMELTNRLARNANVTSAQYTGGAALTANAANITGNAIQQRQQDRWQQDQFNMGMYNTNAGLSSAASGRSSGLMGAGIGAGGAIIGAGIIAI